MSIPLNIKLAVLYSFQVTPYYKGPNASIYTCNAIRFRLTCDKAGKLRVPQPYDAEAIKDFLHQYEKFTLRAGQPEWWESGAPHIEERTQALQDFLEHLEQQQ